LKKSRSAHLEYLKKSRSAHLEYLKKSSLTRLEYLKKSRSTLLEYLKKSRSILLEYLKKSSSTLLDSMYSSRLFTKDMNKDVKIIKRNISEKNCRKSAKTGAFALKKCNLRQYSIIGRPVYGSENTID
jgi:hypothetical protein